MDRRLLVESGIGVLTVFLTGIAAASFISSESLKFGLPLAVGIAWSAGLLYRYVYSERDSE